MERMKQQDKTSSTRQKLVDASLQMFLKQGFVDTTIREICTLAGYSVGSFYRHWKGKEEVFVEIWDAYISDHIQNNIKDIAPGFTTVEIIDHLIINANEFAENIITQKLFATCHMLGINYEYEAMTNWTREYHKTLYRFLQDSTGCQDKERLESCTTVMHFLLDKKAMQNVDGDKGYGRMDEDTFRHMLLSLVELCERG